jgi:hypothetical protein
MPLWGQVVGDDLRAYLKDISETVAAGESEENAQVIAKNALEEIHGQLVQVSTDVECSRYLEALVRHAALEDIVNVFKQLGHHDALVNVSTKCAPSHYFAMHMIGTNALTLCLIDQLSVHSLRLLVSHMYCDSV